VEYSIPDYSTANPIALPFLSGELLVYTKNSLYYYEKPTEIITSHLLFWKKQTNLWCTTAKIYLPDNKYTY